MSSGAPALAATWPLRYGLATGASTVLGTRTVLALCLEHEYCSASMLMLCWYCTGTSGGGYCCGNALHRRCAVRAQHYTALALHMYSTGPALVLYGQRVGAVPPPTGRPLPARPAPAQAHLPLPGGNKATPQLCKDPSIKRMSEHLRDPCHSYDSHDGSGANP